MTRIRPIRLAHIIFILGTAVVFSGNAARLAQASDEVTGRQAAVTLSPLLVTGKTESGSPGLLDQVKFNGLSGVVTTGDLSAGVADLYIARAGGNSFGDTVALRGLTNTPYFGSPAVTFYLDEIPLIGDFTIPENLNGFSNADVVVGPKAEFGFGRAGPGGVVQLRTPDLGRNETKWSLISGNRNYRSLSAYAVGGNADGVQALAAVDLTREDGYVKNEKLGIRLGGTNQKSAVVRIHVQPFKNVGLSVVANVFRSRDEEQPLVPLGGAWDVVNRAQPGWMRVHGANLGLTGVVQLSSGRLSLTSSVNDWRLGPYRSVLGFSFGELVNDADLAQRNYNQEVKFVSSEEGPFRVTAGAFFSSGHTKGAFTRSVGPFPVEASRYEIGARDLATYENMSVVIRPSFSVSLGLRVDRWRKQMSRIEQAPAAQRFDISDESSAILPRLALQWRVDTLTTVYSSISAGYQPGGFSAFTGNRALSAFGPERTRALDVGVFRNSKNGRWTATLRGFLYKIRGYQIERSFATGAASDDYLVVNAPRAQSYGGELLVSWHGIPGWAISLKGGVTDVTLTDFRDPYTGVSYSGKRAPYVPKFDGNFRVSYTSKEGWFAGLDWSVNGRTYYTESENPVFSQGAHGLLSADCGYKSGRWKVWLSGQNLTDAHYFTSISAGTYHGTPGLPRSLRIGLTVIY